MPKIIKDIKSTIISEAKQQLMSEGYSGMTLRSVASGCGIAIGTIYNYFKSKDDLIASFMLEDWMATLADMKAACAERKTPADVFENVYCGIVNYSDKYAKLFGDTEAKKSAHSIFAERHLMLRSQIASLISGTCRNNAVHYTDYLPEFVAQTILYYASEHGEFSVLSEILIQLFRKTPYETCPDKPDKQE